MLLGHLMVTASVSLRTRVYKLRTGTTQIISDLVGIQSTSSSQEFPLNSNGNSFKCGAKVINSYVECLRDPHTSY